MTAIAVPRIQTHTIVDLQAVQSDERQATWRTTVPSVFPGMTLERCRGTPSRGSIQHTRLAESHAWIVDSSPVSVVYYPGGANVNSAFISVMLQLQGTTAVSQGSRTCELKAGSFCFLDNHQKFTMDVPGRCSRFLAWQLPREPVMKHHPVIDRLTAVCFDTEEQAASLVSRCVLNTLQTSTYLKPHQQSVALNSFIRLMGMLDMPPCQGPQKYAHWRIARALAVIEGRFTDSRFTARTVAEEQQISRRQLDRVFLEEMGMTVTARIWERRLACAADLLKDPLHLLRSITNIALSSGFEDAAHFTRAFKKAYRCTPRAWRCRNCLHARD